MAERGLRKILIVGGPRLSLTIAALTAHPVAAAPPSIASRCQAAVEERLADWGAGAERYRDIDGAFGARESRIATGTLGTWVLLHEPPDGAPSLVRVEESGTTRVSFDAGCHESSSFEPRPPAPGLAFTDRDLRALVASTPRGVLFVWSPHMPLSVDAYRTVSELARRMGLSFTALRDPMSDAAYAASVAREAGMPPSALRSFASVELSFRQATLHAPALLVFAHGRFSGMAVPGYREAAALEAAISERLRVAASPNR